MNNILRALWYREINLYRRHMLTSAFMPILTALVLFFAFSLPFRGQVNATEWQGIIQAFILDTVILAITITIYETTARFYWDAQHGNGMVSLYEMGRFSHQPSFFLAQALIGLAKGFFHGVIVLIILLALTSQYSFNINLQAVLLFLLLGALQVVALSKILGLVIRQVEFLSKVLYLGGFPVLLLSGLYLVGDSPLVQFSGLAYYLPPYNWLAGVSKAFLAGTIDYGFLFITLIETVFLVWLSATFFQLDGDR